MKINIEYNDKEIRHALNQLLQRGTDFAPLMRNLSEHLLNAEIGLYYDRSAACLAQGKGAAATSF